MTEKEYIEKFKGLWFYSEAEGNTTQYFLDKYNPANEYNHTNVDITWDTPKGKVITTTYTLDEVERFFMIGDWVFVLNQHQKQFLHELSCKVFQMSESELCSKIMDNEYYTLGERNSLELLIAKYYEL